MVEARKDGGAAFPLTAETMSDCEGMSLRDWFAGQALPSIIAATSAGMHHPTGHSQGGMTVAAAMAVDAYDLADAMLAARANGGSQP